ncbi:MAG: hypothetical protein EZS28_043833 [Streblomastix strix]|uniref:Uncharacterized protein n=1 Tax=Streblomastix strix TaxID=222440 RepID=A0A5J4TT25_9EUKA|nr:MAG: hypothetical protein EZS28_043833 [Streblomastix strix]
MPPPNSGPRDQPPPGQGLYAQRNAAIPQSTIFPPALNAEQEIQRIPNVLKKETIKDHMRKWMLKVFDLIPVSKDDEGQQWPGFCPGVPHATDWRKSKQQGQIPSMNDIRAFWREHNFDLRVAQDTKIGPYHPIVRSQDMTLLTEEVNQENDQDQGVIQDQETIKVREKLELMSIGAKMNLKPETNQEAEAEGLTEEGSIAIMEGDRTIKIETYRIRRYIERHRSITDAQNKSSARLRIQQTGTCLTYMLT